MNRIFFSIIILLVGLASGYYFIILAGYMAYWTSDLPVIIVQILKRYDILDMIYLMDAIRESILLFITAIPVFITSGLLFIYFIKNNIPFIKLLSSIGIIIIPIRASAFYSLCDGQLVSTFLILAIPLLVNLLVINKISSIINAPNKNED